MELNDLSRTKRFISRGCKYSLEKAKKKFDIFYTTRTLLPEIIKNRDPCNDRLAAIIRCG